MKTHYIKREWDETRGDNFDFWGNSMWYFESNENGKVLRQIEEYSIGIRLRYDKKYPSDDYGMLSNKALKLSDPNFEVITDSDFDKIWKKRNPSLCQTIDDDKLTIKELEKIEISFPLSDQLFNEIWTSNFLEKFKHLPTKHAPIQDFEEAMILNEGLESAIAIFESNKSLFSEEVSKELDSVIDFIKEAEANGRALQFWM